MNDRSVHFAGDITADLTANTARGRLTRSTSKDSANVFAVDQSKLKPVLSHKPIPKRKLTVDYESGWSFQSHRSKPKGQDAAFRLLKHKG